MLGLGLGYRLCYCWRPLAIEIKLKWPVRPRVRASFSSCIRSKRVCLHNKVKNSNILFISFTVILRFTKVEIERRHSLRLIATMLTRLRRGCAIVNGTALIRCIAGVYVYGVMYLAGVSLFCTVAVLSMHHRWRRPVPRMLRFVVHDAIGTMLCMNGGGGGGKGKVTSQTPRDSQTGSGASVADPNPTSRRAAHYWTATDWAGGSDHPQCNRDEWIEAARVIDRFFFVVLFVVIAGIITILLIVLAINGPRKVEPISATTDSESFEYPGAAFQPSF